MAVMPKKTMSVPEAGLATRMKKRAKLLANFLGATKELTNEYVELAEITDSELNEISFTVVQRGNRKATAKMLAAKGLSTREIAEITGWSYKTIERDLRTNVPQIGTNVPPSKPSTTDRAAKERRAAEVAEEAAAVSSGRRSAASGASRTPRASAFAMPHRSTGRLRRRKRPSRRANGARRQLPGPGIGRRPSPRSRAARARAAGEASIGDQARARAD
jgi:hypothetical protein